MVLKNAIPEFNFAGLHRKLYNGGNQTFRTSQVTKVIIQQHYLNLQNT